VLEVVAEEQAEIIVHWPPLHRRCHWRRECSVLVVGRSTVITLDRIVRPEFTSCKGLREMYHSVDIISGSPHRRRHLEFVHWEAVAASRES
jgi:hypothetical protein